MTTGNYRPPPPNRDSNIQRARIEGGVRFTLGDALDSDSMAVLRAVAKVVRRDGKRVKLGDKPKRHKRRKTSGR